MNDARRHRDTAGQLLRLRELRARRAERERAEALRAQQRALDAVRDAEALFDRRRQDLRALLASRASAADAPRLLPWAEARREALEDAVERGEYALLDEQEALETADRQLDRARAAWRAAHAQQRAADEALRRAQRAWRLAAERVAERDDDAAARPSDSVFHPFPGAFR